MNKQFIYAWLNKLKEYWFNKDIEKAISLFKHTTFYQETPFMKPYTTLEEIKKEWQHVKEENIKSINIKVLAIDGNTVIAEWQLSQNDTNYDGIYEIKFNDNLECIYFKSWEMNDKQYIPESVLKYGFEFDWDEEDVWKLDYPTKEINIKELEWHFNIPFWNWNNEWYTLKPIDVINNPEKYKEQYDRIMASDISYPIDVMENKGRLVILDGLHRLVKYKLLGMDKIKVRIIPRSEIKNISK
ncbi:MAG: ParB/RepB/Spo0J family partition protein [Ruminococcus sp.]|nr:ParB/RepB/Spo0J family partition protein [Ruminococcus sp.]